MIYYVCNRKNKVEHCLEYCYHGQPHEADGCTGDEICYIESKSGIVVRCCPATKKELIEYEEKKKIEEKNYINPWN